MDESTTLDDDEEISLGDLDLSRVQEWDTSKVVAFWRSFHTTAFSERPRRPIQSDALRLLITYILRFNIDGRHMLKKFEWPLFWTMIYRSFDEDNREIVALAIIERVRLLRKYTKSTNDRHLLQTPRGPEASPLTPRDSSSSTMTGTTTQPLEMSRFSPQAPSYSPLTARTKSPSWHPQFPSARNSLAVQSSGDRLSFLSSPPHPTATAIIRALSVWRSDMLPRDVRVWSYAHLIWWMLEGASHPIFKHPERKCDQNVRQRFCGRLVTHTYSGEDLLDVCNESEIRRWCADLNYAERHVLGLDGFVDRLRDYADDYIRQYEDVYNNSTSAADHAASFIATQSAAQHERNFRDDDSPLARRTSSYQAMIQDSIDHG